MKSAFSKVRLACCAIAAFLVVGSLQAEVRYISGDINNNLPSADGEVQDVSTDGTLVLLSIDLPVSGLPPTPGVSRGGLYVRNISTGSLTFVGVPIGGENNNDPTGEMEATMSDDGTKVAWTRGSDKTIFWRDHSRGITRSITPNADGQSRRPIISANGRYVAYVSIARNLVANTALLPANGRAAVYLYDSQTETTTVASLRHDGTALTSGVGLTGPDVEFDFSGDGRFVFFTTDSAGVHPDRPAGNAFYWIYRRNLATGAIDIVNRNESGAIVNANFSTPRSDITGTRVAFTGSFLFLSTAQLPQGFVQPLGTFDAFLKDLGTAAVWRLSKPTDNGGHDGAFSAGGLAISANGAVVAFGSSSTKLVAEPTDSPGSSDSLDIFRVDIGANGAMTTSLVTKPAVGAGNVGFRAGPIVSGDGKYVAFTTSHVFSLLGQGTDSNFHIQSFAVGTLPAIQVPAVTFASWASVLPANGRSLLSVPLNDGINNMQKFVHKIDPLTSNRANLPAVSLATGSSLGVVRDSRLYLKITFKVRADLPSDFKVTVNASDTVQGAASSSTAARLVGTPTTEAGLTTFTYRSAQPVEASSASFVAVKIEGPAGQ